MSGFFRVGIFFRFRSCFTEMPVTCGAWIDIFPCVAFLPVILLPKLQGVCPMIKHVMIAIVPLAAVLVLPLLFRWTLHSEENPVVADGQVTRLVIVTPHNESIRHEFDLAFKRWYRDAYNQNVDIDWRSPGGTSDIVRQVDDLFHGSFKTYWQASGKSWNEIVAEAFNNKYLDPNDDKADPQAHEARQLFLQSEVGIGVDLFFGGGQYDLYQQARKGHAVDSGLLASHPEWFREDVMPQSYSGEVFYDPQGRYVGACLSAFGICYNIDRIEMLGAEPPARWADLAEPVFFQQTAIADPTKSGSITKCFEMMIQQTMQEAVAATDDEDAGKAKGWDDGLNLIKRISANARYLTDSASRVPRDVASGDTAAGMCIDFYGRAEAQWTAQQSGGRERVRYVTPTGGSSISVDPILLFRGAPNREVAIRFMEFVLSDAGQKLWNYRKDTPGGPEKYVLRRMPVRRDMYAPENRQYMADADTDPYAEAAGFVYHGGWTGRHFGLIRQIIRIMVMDAGPELREAWGAILAAGGPEAVPEAMVAFNALPFSYDQAGDVGQKLSGHGTEDDVLTAMKQQQEYADFFRKTYNKARLLALR